MMKSVKNIDQYIRTFPEDIQIILRKIRQVVKTAAPKAVETIKYGMPTLVLNGNLIHFAAMKNHIGFYPAPSAIVAFKKELTKYQTSKGAIRFPLSNPIPYSLITKIVKFRVKENLKKVKK